MVFDKIKKFIKNIKTNIVRKSEVEDILNINLSYIESDLIPMLEEISKADESSFNKATISILSNVLKGRTAKDIISSEIKMYENILKNRRELEKLIGKLPENITVDHITLQQAAILNLVSNLSEMVLLSMDLNIALFLDIKSKELPKMLVETFLKNTVNSKALMEMFLNIDGEIKAIHKTNNEININEENVALESILSSKGALGFAIVETVFEKIAKTVYTIRVWSVDLELKKFELLKEKKQFLLKKLLEIENELKKNPDDVQLKKAKEVYVKRIVELTQQIEKIEDI